MTTEESMTTLISNVQGFIVNEKQRLHIKGQFDSSMKQNNTRTNIKAHKKVIQDFFRSDAHSNNSMVAIQVALDGSQTEANTVWVIPTTKKKKTKLNFEDRLAMAVVQMLSEPNAVNAEPSCRASFLATRVLIPMLLEAMQNPEITSLPITDQAKAIAKAVAKPVPVSQTGEMLYADRMANDDKLNVTGVKMVTQLPSDISRIIYLNPRS
jgi:hypothetical protein